MAMPDVDALSAELLSLEPVRSVGRVSGVTGSVIEVEGLSSRARLGDQVAIHRHGADRLRGEIIHLSRAVVTILPESDQSGVSLGDRVVLCNPAQVAPCEAWIGRIVDPFGHPLDGRALRRGPSPRRLIAEPPPPVARKALGARLETGMAAFNTFLPVVRGQRLGLFAGSGVGKSNLLGRLGREMQADVVVFALIGERGRELREFVEATLGPEGMKRAVIVAATSDQSPLARRRCAWTAMCIAEYFRDIGRHVLFLADSITRFAEAHREVAVAGGELPALRGFPASTAHMIMSLCERAGPGREGAGDITALFSVLVAGSDMDEPVADILRGVLDGHVVLDRAIAERGRYPAIDLLRSVSRSLPRAATDPENALIGRGRSLLGTYARSEPMIRAGLYVHGSDPAVDEAVGVWADLDAFIAEKESVSIENSFQRLGLLLRRASKDAPRVQQTSSASKAPRRAARPTSQVTTLPS